MRSFASAWLVLFGTAGIGAAAGAENPRDLIERAVKAHGGAKVLEQCLAIRVKTKITWAVADPSESKPIAGEMMWAGSRSRMVFRFGDAEHTVPYIVVLDGKNSWRSFNGQVQNLSAEEIASVRKFEHVDRVTGLAALLTDKGFTFALLPEMRVEGRRARGVKVSYKDQVDTNLYFDRQTGLLVKYTYRGKNLTEEKESLQERILCDYREPDLASADEKMLRDAKIDATGPALQEFVRKQTPRPETSERARVSIRRLGDSAFAIREQASRDVVALGAVAVPLLCEAAKNDDREIARRARECLQQIGVEGSKARIGAAIRLLGLRRPAGTAEVLLDYLPVADADAADEVRAVLFAVAHDAGPPNPALSRALHDASPLRRAAATAALEKDGGAYARQPGRRLFAPRQKMAMKEKSSIDGKQRVDWEMFDFEFFNAFDDKLFAKP